MNVHMDNRLWHRLPVEVRRHVDGLLHDGQSFAAAKAIWDSGIEPRPGIHECLVLSAERCADLGAGFGPAPTPPLDPDVLIREVEALPARPVAIEALWDGDTFSWMVEIVVITAEPRAEHSIASIRRGAGPIGAARPPEAEEATRVGRALAEHFDVPFHFPSPDAPEPPGDAAPRW